MVTGAGQGIGLAICERILRDGQYAVALLESSPEGRNAAERLRTEGGDVLHVQCDVSSESDVVSAMEAVTEFGSVRCVINNAGIFPRMSALQMDFEDWMKVVRFLKQNLSATSGRPNRVIWEFESNKDVYYDFSKNVRFE